jgi:hypothetical protein
MWAYECRSGAVILDKLTVTQIINKFHASYGTSMCSQEPPILPNLMNPIHTLQFH